MNAKSALFVAAATVGMVAVGEVWDVKFTLKTIQNDKRTSVTIRGAYDDAANAYLFWNDKTKETLKDVEFSVTKPTYYGNNVAKNAQLAWGKDAANPDGLLVAGGFGRSTISGQAAGTYGGKPAAGTWSIKTSRKTFDKLVAKKVVDRTPDTAASAAAHEAFAKQWGAGSVVADLEKQAADSAAKVEELTQQVAAQAAEAAEAQEKLDAAQKDLDAATAQVAETKEQLAAAQEDVKAAKAATESAVAAATAETKEQLDAATKDLDAATNQLAELETKYEEQTVLVSNLTEAVEQLSQKPDVNTGLVVQVAESYQTDVVGFIDSTLQLETVKKSLKMADTNVDVAMKAYVEEFAAASNALIDATVELDDMKAFDAKKYEDISYSNKFITAATVKANISDPVWRVSALAGLADVDAVAVGDAALMEELYDWVSITNNLVGLTNVTYEAWTNAYVYMTNCEAAVEQSQENADFWWSQWIKADGGYAWQLANYEAETNNLAGLKKDLEAAAYTNDVKAAERDAAKKAFDAFGNGDDLKKIDGIASQASMDLDAKMAKWGAYTVDDFHKKVIPDQEAKTNELTLAIHDPAAIPSEGGIQDQLDDLVVAGVITGYDTKGVTGANQAAWEAYYTVNVTGKQKTIELQEKTVAKFEANIKSEIELAKVLVGDDVDLNDPKWVKNLQDAYYALELADEKLAPIVIEAAKKWGITLVFKK